MSIAAAIEEMIARGMALDDALDIAELLEAQQQIDTRAREYRRDVALEVWNDLRRFVFERDGPQCVYCRDPVDFTFCCDHVIPKSRGGKTEALNLAVCCKPCNSSKKDLTLSEWRGRR